MFRSILAFVVLVAAASQVSAQSLGTFKWQLQPYCNVVTMNVTGVAGIYTLEGFDDQCGGGTRAPLTGVATPNPDGTIGFGMSLVTSPGGHGVQMEARISMASLGGPWTDSDGNTGTFAFNQNTGGVPRPVPVNGSVIPPVFGLQPDGGFVASGAVGTGSIPKSGAGTRMMWHPKKAAFRAGQVQGTQWDDAAVGNFSTALGQNVVASGLAAFAAGSGSLATGDSAVALGDSARAEGTAAFAAGLAAQAVGRASVALGEQAKATGPGSLAAGLLAEATDNDNVAIGARAKATGYQSVAIGARAKATGQESLAGSGSAADGLLSVALGGAQATRDRAVAIGYNTLAAALDSLALGSHVTILPGGSGSIVIGDGINNGFVTQVSEPNQFVVRARGGTTISSNGAMTTGVKLAPNASSWSSLSDVNGKENFRDLDGSDLLAKLATMSIREWNYKAQDASIRHVGPTAQDFHAAFGLGEDPLRISTIDADGVALAAVKALEARTREQNGRLTAQNDALAAELAALRARLAALEQKQD